MADYCKQCSIELFDEDFGDLKGLTHNDGRNRLVVALCEGCGATYVDENGVCQGKWCQSGHKDLLSIKVRAIESVFAFNGGKV